MGRFAPSKQVYVYMTPANMINSLLVLAWNIRQNTRQFHTFIRGTAAAFLATLFARPTHFAVAAVLLFADLAPLADSLFPLSVAAHQYTHLS